MWFILHVLAPELLEEFKLLVDFGFGGEGFDSSRWYNIIFWGDIRRTHIVAALLVGELAANTGTRFSRGLGLGNGPCRVPPHPSQEHELPASITTPSCTNAYMSMSTPPPQKKCPDFSSTLPPSPPASHEASPSHPGLPRASAIPSHLVSDAHSITGSLRAIFSGQYTPQHARVTFHTSAAEFERLHDEFLAPGADCDGTDDDDFKTWCSNKLRWDWDPHTEEFSLRMPDVLHESFIKQLRTHVLKRRDELADRWHASGNANAAAVLRMIKDEGNSTITFDHRQRMKNWGARDTEELSAHRRGASGELESLQESAQVDITTTFGSSTSRETEGKAAQRIPDIALMHEEQRHYPPLVMEIGNSQSIESLSLTGEAYILDSDNFIKTVVALKLPYLPKSTQKAAKSGKTPDRSATVTLWRSALNASGMGDVEISIDKVPFRNDKGQTQQGEFQLLVRDAMPPSIIQNEDPTSTTFLTQSELNETLAKITFAELSAMLTAADEEKRAGRDSKKAEEEPERRIWGITY
ncbi:uncharacterized protein MYCFIDRAFT_180038 [Pseudocercospora fijiensis CIRAD86]|uniref:Uncharacterized protein n=1 Tax=Pseudocercospora fijiensis (strain CIRAD86) TaxID=383855 RepID=M2YH64_PSEFD|nr:uncharacterized protein MYCFIDRAFT_180038 [Pseudocercospora fijiensis CIRAD86]EME77165.1 hypothetical protein MYCFIDRAFT_180038 [Pseudocercospora fijiensis CIRAD86]